MIITGIDPGASGAITKLKLDGTHIDTFAFQGKTESEIVNYFRTMAMENALVADMWAFLEKLQSRPRDTPRTAWVLGGSYRALRYCLFYAGIPFEEISPVRWQKVVGLAYRVGWTDSQKEKAQVQLVAQLFPGLKVTQKTAASVLQAEAGRRIKIKREKLEV